MKKEMYRVQSEPEPQLKKMNYKALEYLGWFRSDAQSLGNWCTQLFGGEVDLSSERAAELKAAAENALTELEDDVTNIKKYLDEYVPSNVNESESER